MHQLGLRLRPNPSGGFLDPLCAACAMLGQVVVVRWARSAGLPVSSSLPAWVCDCGLALLLVDKRVQAGAGRVWIIENKQVQPFLCLTQVEASRCSYANMLILGDGCF